MSAAALPPTASTTLVILLGASAWPNSPGFHASKAFEHAAQGFRDYVLDPQGFRLPKENLFDLFDSLTGESDQLEMLGSFLEERIQAQKAANQAVRDVLVYYVGHGGFDGPSANFYLLPRRANASSLRASGMAIDALAEVLREKARQTRRYLFLDCCFAAAAFRTFQGGPDQAAITKTRDAFAVQTRSSGSPTRGTVLLCSSDQKTPSLLLPDESCTMFSHALLDVLRNGDLHRPLQLSLRDIKELAEDRLAALPEQNAPRPGLYSPDQSEGDVADVPFFPNPRAEEEQARQAEEERRHLAEEAERVRRAEEERLRQAEEARQREIEEERAHKEKEAEQARLEEEARVRLAKEAEQARLAEEERRRQAEEDQVRKAQEEQAGLAEEERRRQVEEAKQARPAEEKRVRIVVVPPVPRPVRTLYIVLIALLVAIVGSAGLVSALLVPKVSTPSQGLPRRDGAGLVSALLVPKPTTTPSPVPTVLGQARFLSSPNAVPPGSIDEVEITIQHISNAPAGEQYYAWLQTSSESILPIHWVLIPHNGSLSSTYTNPHLLTVKPYLLLITTEKMDHVVPTFDPNARFYYARLPGTIQNSATFDILSCPQSASNNVCMS